MNPSIFEGIELLKSINQSIVRKKISSKIVICPPSLIIRDAIRIFSNSSISVGSQDCHYAQIGPFTGDLSYKMFEDIGCEYSIIGHSERRANHFESNKLIFEKLNSLNKSKIMPILCVGESFDEKNSGKASEAVIRQINESGINELEFKQKIIAYEPIWAIGSGKTPTKDEIMTIHGKIREKLNSKPNSNNIKVLYGGSVNVENASDIFSIKGVDGALIGGASLKQADFIKIIESVKI
tara:strand:- start:905 stop:1618 length:714 start_codon:yes stop_codon:yes gene_type:complete